MQDTRTNREDDMSSNTHNVGSGLLHGEGVLSHGSWRQGVGFDESTEEIHL